MDQGGFRIALQLIYATYLPRGAALVVLRCFSSNWTYGGNVG